MLPTLSSRIQDENAHPVYRVSLGAKFIPATTHHRTVFGDVSNVDNSVPLHRNPPSLICAGTTVRTRSVIPAETRASLSGPASAREPELILRQPSARSRRVWSPSDVPEVDRPDLGDAQKAGEYAAEIITSLQAEETMQMPKADYMETCQPALTPKMRAILLDWLVEVHNKFKLSPETLYLAVNFVDRYLSMVGNVARSNLQLVGVTCLLIAAKFQEIHPPRISDLVYITDKAYSKADILAMEVACLNKLGFEVAVGSSYCFLQRNIKLAKCEILHQHTAQFLLELTLPEYNMIRHPPSKLAASVLYLCNRIFKTTPSWPSHIAEATGYQELDVKPCAKEICSILQKSEQSALKAIRKKFASPKFSKVSQIIVA